MSAGRPREFDVDKALDRALELFWRKGYEGTSMSDLTSALGITRASLYAAFGNKEALFRRVMDLYETRAGAYRVAADATASSDEVVRVLLMGSAEHYGDNRDPPGCLGVQGALACGSDAEHVRNDLAARRLRGEHAVRRRLQRAANQGDLPGLEDPADLARYVSALIYGMAVLAAGGATASELRAVAEVALNHWPKGRTHR